MARTPFVPEFIVVHLGAPDNAGAENLTVTFPDYIKNVASSEIFPTWPEAALRANIYAQVSFALNRVYTEWYRSRGYDFDITNSTAFDQSFVPNRDIFENISRLVDELFNSYLKRPGAVEPLFAAYCDGERVQCNGLSQWGSVALAEQGLGPYDILTRYYGADLSIIRDAPVEPRIPSYPGRLIRLGEVSSEVRDIQVRLNRISTNYPLIPKIYPLSGVFDESTQAAVVAFQQQFDLAADGIVGSATWYRIAYLYTAVKRLAEVDSEGLSLEDISRQFRQTLSLGDSGIEVELLQFYLRSLSLVFESILRPDRSGVYDESTVQSVRSFQQLQGLNEDGIAGPDTWNALATLFLDAYGAQQAQSGLTGEDVFRQLLVEGSQGAAVEQLQENLNELRATYPQIAAVPVTGYYGESTTQAVLTAQQLFGINQTGTVGPLTWTAIASALSDQRMGAQSAQEQFPGYTLQEDG